MKKRLYFVLPNLATAQTVHNELLLARINEDHIHAIAKEGVNLNDLPEASFLQKSDVIHGAQLGFIIGGFTGVLMGSFAAAYGFIVPGLEVWSVGSLAIGGAFLGTWTSSMVAINIPNTRLKPFQKALDNGQILLAVDVVAKRVDEITDMVARHHPEAEMHPVEPTIPAFP